jgi:hypothetical protein
MTKFVVVDAAPATLEKGEIVINQPNFLEQIEANKKKAPRNGLIAVNHVREILQSIGVKYDSELNAMRIKLVGYVGVPFKNNEELSAIIVRILRAEYPSIFEKVLDHELRNRPLGTKLIYYVGNFKGTTAFFKQGIDNIDESDVESYMTGKPKKTVGKPAVTNEEAKERGKHTANTGSTNE